VNDQERVGPRRRSAAEAAQLVAEYEASGLSRAEFCRERRLSLNTLNRYCARQRAIAGAGLGKLLEVELRNAGAQANAASGLCVHLCGGYRIEIARGFDPETLTRLVRALERI
jgi:hypothetical protein